MEPWRGTLPMCRSWIRDSGRDKDTKMKTDNPASFRESNTLFSRQNNWQYCTFWSLPCNESEHLRPRIGAAEYELEDHGMVQAWDYMELSHRESVNPIWISSRCYAGTQVCLVLHIHTLSTSLVPLQMEHGYMGQVLLLHTWKDRSLLHLGSELGL
jgi:hypothetical protein